MNDPSGEAPVADGEVSIIASGYRWASQLTGKNLVGLEVVGIETVLES